MVASLRQDDKGFLESGGLNRFLFMTTAEQRHPIPTRPVSTAEIWTSSCRFVKKNYECCKKNPFRSFSPIESTKGGQTIVTEKTLCPVRVQRIMTTRLHISYRHPTYYTIHVFDEAEIMGKMQEFLTGVFKPGGDSHPPHPKILISCRVCFISYDDFIKTDLLSAKQPSSSFHKPVESR